MWTVAFRWKIKNKKTNYIKVDAPINSVYRILEDKMDEVQMEINENKKDDYKNNSADFHSFETVYNPAADIQVLKKKNFYLASKSNSTLILH